MLMQRRDCGCVNSGSGGGGTYNSTLRHAPKTQVCLQGKKCNKSINVLVEGKKVKKREEEEEEEIKPT